MVYIGLPHKQTRAVSQYTTQKIIAIIHTVFDCSVQGRQNRPSFTKFREDILKFIREFGDNLKHELRLI